MSSDDKIAGRSGGVEVVADQGDDGSFEIRLERQGDTEPVAVPKPVEEAGAWRAAATTPAAETRSAPKALVWGVLATGIAVLIGGVYALSSSPSQLNGSRPKTVSVSAEPQFRGYMVEGRSPARASNLRLEFGAQDDETEDEDSFDYDQELNPDLAPGVDIAPSTGTAGRPTVRSGAVRGFDGLDDAEEDPFAGMTRVERNEAGREMLMEILEEKVADIRRAREAEGDAEPAQEPEAELVEPEFEGELIDEFDYEAEFDEDYELYE